MGRMGVVAVMTAVLAGILAGKHECRKLSDALTSSLPDLSDFDIPVGASIVANFVNTPRGIGPKHPRCVFMTHGRECMNVSRRVPIFEGKFCRGLVCLMDVIPGPPECMLKVGSQRGDPTNSTRNLTCGLDPEDGLVSNPMKPVFGPPASTAETELGGLPPGVQQKVFYPCLKGELHPVVRLSFPKVFSDNYTCLGNPKCLKQGLSSQIVCYTTGQVRFSLISGGSGRKNKNLTLLLLLVSLTSFVMQT